jgi:gliding motility-associated lipoprotein GldH
MRTIGLLFFLLTLFSIQSCSNPSSINPYEFSNGWKTNEIVDFNFKGPQDSSRQDLFLILRHNKNYAFSNIFLITEIKFENDSIKIDTLEYVLSEKNGKWLGKKKLSVVEHTLNYKKNLKLIKDSAYTITVRNSMRLNNEISPIRNLENVLDLGLLIQSAE